MNSSVKFLLLVVFIFLIHACKKGNDPAAPVITIPVLTTTGLSEINQSSAFSGGNISSDGGSEVTVRGICWGTAHKPTTSSSKTTEGTGIGSFICYLSGLTPNTAYYVRAFATNSEGTGYGNEISFTTKPVSLATVTQTFVTSITLRSALARAYIANSGGEALLERGFCWSTSQNPAITDSKISDGGLEAENYSIHITGLTENTTYYLRAYATNSIGTAYGDQLTFKTAFEFSQIIFNPDLTYGSISDIEGNIYKTIQIGTQTWMAENLITSQLSDGTPIPNVTEGQDWRALTTPGYCWYNNETNFTKSYGALYNWYAVNTGKLCPTGWHVPSDNEWTVFVDFHGGMEAANAKIRENGTTHWQSITSDATNLSGFTALPGGCRFWDGQFNGFGILMYFWSSTKYYESGGLSLEWMYLSDGSYSSSGSGRGNTGSNDGLSVRCVKN
jgi:uncharacterized protein (TIGR02145 family)